ncbi:M20/M25/M40 family metallo-hydrolase [Kordia algicida OT-1]|uniref:Putative peptidase, M28 family protein n=1 Tax=Kordia algicida OT-1 TaxID=391587 RepID=A9DME5_9FLAO|nr:M20/M25/M40 family metallo-hydrolase [Kordia algicida]EDP97687.1 putative peptidase, M28 family protein [Kordia algicida OT-1]
MKQLKNIFRICLLSLVIFSCKTKEIVIQAQEVDDIVTYLASDELEGRDTGSEGIEKAAVYIENYFKDNGVKPYFDTYRDSFTVKGKEAFNVIGYLEGNDPNLKNEFVIIGAHYDHIGFAEPVGDDKIANGANDNAAGVGTVMAMAKYFAKTKSNKRSILFTLFSAEEKGLLGSKHLAKTLKNEGIDLYIMLNYEMVGVPLVGKDYTAYVTGFNKTNLAEKMNEYAGKKIAGFLPKAGEFRLFMRSDNYPFFQEFNVPCQTFCTFDFTNFDHYHKVGDESDKMDFNHMANFVNTFIPAVRKAVNAPTKEIKLNPSK